MGIGKSKITPSIDVDDMLKKVESNHELEAEKQDADKRLTEIREAKEALLKIHRDLLDVLKLRVRLRWYCRRQLVVPITLSTAFALRL